MLTGYTFDTLPVHPQPERLESLTGYMTRLAEANGIRAVYGASAVFFPDHSRQVIRPMADYPPASFGALPAVAACSEEALLATTFYHLVRKFDRPTQPQAAGQFLAGVLARQLRYCPLCLQAERPTYSLAWRFLSLPGCARHGCRLLDRCSHCGHAIPFLATPLKVGLCPGCGGELGGGTVEPLDEDRRKISQAHYEDLAFLLSPPGEGAEPRLPPIGPRLAYRREVRQMTVEDVALQTGKSPRLVRALEHRVLERGVKFWNYLDYAACLGLTLREMFNTDLPPARRERVHRLSAEAFRAREADLARQIREAVATLRSQGRPLTQPAVCELVGVSLTCMAYYPRAKAALAEVGKEGRRHSRHRAQRREQELAEQVRQAIADLGSRGQPVTRSAVARLVGVSPPTLAYYPQVNAIVARSAEKPRRTPAQPRQQPCPPRLVERVQAAIESLRSQDRRLTQRAICQAARLTQGSLRRYTQLKWAAEACRQDSRRYTQRRKQERAEKIQQAVESLRSQGRPVTQQAICDLLGVTRSVLTDAYPRVEAILAQAAAERRSYDQRQAQQRERTMLEKAHQAMADLKSQGSPVTRQAVCRQAGIPTHPSAYPQLTALLKQVVEEGRADTRRRRQVREQELVEAVRAAIERLASAGKPATQKAICRAVNMARPALRSYPRVKEILDRVVADGRRGSQPAAAEAMASSEQRSIASPGAPRPD